MTSVVFVCWGNICRSPMAERVARRYLDDAGLPDVVVTSAGTSAEELGNPIDSRARRTLRDHGYTSDGHRARRITRDEISENDLVVAMEDVHIDRMRHIAGGADLDHVRLLSDFDPGAEPGEGVPDPWYGGQDGFTRTLEMIEQAMPAVVARVQELARSDR